MPWRQLKEGWRAMLAGKQWVNHHDWVKLALMTLLMFVFMLLAVTETIPFLLALILGVVLCVGAGYWLGNRKWLLIPLLAMLVEITVAIPTVIGATNPEETPFSIILEAPFWTGIPALVGAGVGYALRKQARSGSPDDSWINSGR
jgi:hypothetical protein